MKIPSSLVAVMNRMTARVRSLVGSRAYPTNGQAIIWFAITVMLLIMCVAIVTDTGQVWMNRRALQNATDAAALAGVQQLPNDVSGARSFACDYGASKNAISGMTIECGGTDISIYQTSYPNDTIKVTAHKTIMPLIGGLFGWPNITISAHATARIGAAAAACLFPLAQTQDLLVASGVWGGNGVILNKATILKNGASGTPLALQVYDSSSKSDFRNVVGSPDGCDGTQDSYATTSTGNFVGPLDQGMADRQTLWQAQGTCPSMNPSTYLQPDGTLKNGSVVLTPETCYRMVKIPLLDTNSSDLQGTKTWKIRGFAVFYIANWCGQSSTPKMASNLCPAPSPPFPSGTQLKGGELWGYYVGMLPVAGGSDYHGYVDGFIKVAVLIE